MPHHDDYSQWPKATTNFQLCVFNIHSLTHLSTWRTRNGPIKMSKSANKMLVIESPQMDEKKLRKSQTISCQFRRQINSNHWDDEWWIESSQIKIVEVIGEKKNTWAKNSLGKIGATFWDCHSVFVSLEISVRGFFSSLAIHRDSSH